MRTAKVSNTFRGGNLPEDGNGHVPWLPYGFLTYDLDRTMTRTITSIWLFGLNIQEYSLCCSCESHRTHSASCVNRGNPRKLESQTSCFEEITTGPTLHCRYGLTPSRLCVNAPRRCFTHEDSRAPTISTWSHATHFHIVVDIFSMPETVLIPGSEVEDDGSACRMQLMGKPCCAQ